MTDQAYNQPGAQNSLVQPEKRDIYAPRPIVPANRYSGGPMVRPWLIDPFLGPGHWLWKRTVYREHRRPVLLERPIWDYKYKKDIYDPAQYPGL